MQGCHCLGGHKFPKLWHKVVIHVQVLTQIGLDQLICVFIAVPKNTRAKSWKSNGLAYFDRLYYVVCRFIKFALQCPRSMAIKMGHYIEIWIMLYTLFLNRGHFICFYFQKRSYHCFSLILHVTILSHTSNYS